MMDRRAIGGKNRRRLRPTAAATLFIAGLAALGIKAARPS
jgi:hypothetical protein